MSSPFVIIECDFPLYLSNKTNSAAAMLNSLLYKPSCEGLSVLIELFFLLINKLSDTKNRSLL